MIYFDNAATTFPKPDCVRCAVMDSLRCFAANPGRAGHRLSARAAERVFEARESLASFFGGKTERTVFMLNCTHAINFALKGVLRQGDHVIISSLEHNAVLRPLEAMKEAGTITFDVARVEPQSERQTLENVRSLIRPETRLLFMTHVSNVFGTVLPVTALSALAQKHGLLFGLDAAQSAGVYDLNMETLGLDFLCLPGHKGLYGPMGTGALLLSDRVTPRTLIEGGTGSLSLQRKQPAFLPDALESGTLNLSGICGLGAGVSFVRRIGAAAIRSHEEALIRLLREDLSVIPGVETFEQMAGGTLLSLRVAGQAAEETGRLLDRCGFAVRAGYHCAALAHTTYGTADTGTVRVSPSVFSTKNQIKNFSFSLNQIALRTII